MERARDALTEALDWIQRQISKQQERALSAALELNAARAANNGHKTTPNMPQSVSS
jgi:hypothetical protein